MAGNSDSTVAPVSSDTLRERELWDKLPKMVRLRLIEGKYDYSAEQVWAAFFSVRKELPEETENESWWRVVEMVDFNDRDMGARERKMYQELVVELREEKRQRIQNAFLRAS